MVVAQPVPADVESWFAAQLGRAIAPPPGRRLRSDRDADDVDDVLPAAIEIDLRGLALHFTYVDAAGCESERTVRCTRALVGDRPPVLVAFCCLRNASRSFRIDRIREVVDLETGEVTEAAAFFASLGVWRDDPMGRFLARARAGLTVLMAVAAADGRVFADEVEVVARWVDRLADLHGIALGADDLDAIVRVARNLRPDAEAAVVALKSALGTAAEADLLARYMRQMVEADGMVSAEEVSLLEVLAVAAGRRRPS